MRYFEITSKKTGKRLGIVKAKDRSNAIDILSSRKQLPNKVTIYPAKLVKSKNPKSKLTIYQNPFDSSKYYKKLFEGKL